MQDNPDKYVDYALAQARAYISQNRHSPKLKGKAEAETAEIQAFLASKPYDTEAVRAAVKAMIDERLAGKVAVEEGIKPQITYLSGPLGANRMLRGMAGKEGAEVGAEMKATLELDGAVDSHFSAYKKTVSEKLLNGAEPKPYGKWRPLLSGVDQAVQLAAEENRYNLVVDNTMALSDGQVQGGIAHLKKQAEKSTLRMVAVALTPEQSKAEAAALGMDEDEAVHTARDFRRSFPSLMSAVPNLTLVDREGTVIYQQKEGKETRRDRAKMEVWKGAFNEGPLPQSRLVIDVQSSGLPPLPGSGVQSR